MQNIFFHYSSLSTTGPDGDCSKTSPEPANKTAESAVAPPKSKVIASIFDDGYGSTASLKNANNESYSSIDDMTSEISVRATSPSDSIRKLPKKHAIKTKTEKLEFEVVGESPEPINETNIDRTILNELEKIKIDLKSIEETMETPTVVVDAATLTNALPIDEKILVKELIVIKQENLEYIPPCEPLVLIQPDENEPRKAVYSPVEEDFSRVNANKIEIIARENTNKVEIPAEQEVVCFDVSSEKAQFDTVRLVETIHASEDELPIAQIVSLQLEGKKNNESFFSDNKLKVSSKIFTLPVKNVCLNF